MDPLPSPPPVPTATRSSVPSAPAAAGTPLPAGTPAFPGRLRTRAAPPALPDAGSGIRRTFAGARASPPRGKGLFVAGARASAPRDKRLPVVGARTGAPRNRRLPGAGAWAGAPRDKRPPGAGAWAGAAGRALALVAALLAMASPLDARSPEAVSPAVEDPDGLRVGLMLGGTSFVGLTVEYQWDTRGLELTVGTFSLRDLSVTAVGKQYFGGGSARGFVGLGLWGVAARGEERPGFALVARAPVGVDWQAATRHALGLEIALNRALAVRRTDPEDDTPPRKGLVPLPGVYYRYSAER